MEEDTINLKYCMQRNHKRWRKGTQRLQYESDKGEDGVPMTDSRVLLKTVWDDEDHGTTCQLDYEFLVLFEYLHWEAHVQYCEEEARYFLKNMSCGFYDEAQIDADKSQVIEMIRGQWMLQEFILKLIRELEEQVDNEQTIFKKAHEIVLNTDLLWNITLRFRRDQFRIRGSDGEMYLS